MLCLRHRASLSPVWISRARIIAGSNLRDATRRGSAGFTRLDAAMPETSLSGAPARYAGGLHDVGAGVHAWLQPNGSWGESNAGLIAGDGASVLVDTLWDVALTRRMLDAMEPLTRGAPIEVVVNTHSDGDHWWGNELLADRRIVTSAASAQVMAGTEVRELQRFRALAGALRAGARLPVPGRAKLAQVGGYFGAMMAPYDWSAIELTQPTEIFDEQTLLRVGGRELGCYRVGPAHTPGDLIVHVPDARVVLCADIGFIGSTPVMWAGPAERWIAAIDRVLELDPERIVPGHGPVTDADGMGRCGTTGPGCWSLRGPATTPEKPRGRRRARSPSRTSSRPCPGPAGRTRSAS